MRIIQNFSSLKNQKRYPETDILIWASSLCRYKSFGYTLKLYCRKSDFKFLKKYHLFEMYDEIDTQCLEYYEKHKEVNDKKFWSDRKLTIIYNEFFSCNNSDFIYSDTDVLMNEPFNIENCDAIVWSPEPRIVRRDQFGNIDWSATIYPDWDFISKPLRYKMPYYIKNTNDAYNCGVLYFKNKNVFLEYYNEYKKFAINNPCIINSSISVGDINNNIFACNSEQRILKAVLTQLNVKVKPVMRERLYGISKEGCHFNLFRVGWKNIANGIPQPLVIYQILNDVIHECLVILKTLDMDLYNFYSNLDWILESDIMNKYDKNPNDIIITKYN